MTYKIRNNLIETLTAQSITKQITINQEPITTPKLQDFDLGQAHKEWKGI